MGYPLDSAYPNIWYGELSGFGRAGNAILAAKDARQEHHAGGQATSGFRRLHEYHQLEPGLLEMVIRGEGVRQAPLLHNCDGKAVGKAPVLVMPTLVQLYRRLNQIGAERRHLDVRIPMESPVALGRRPPRGDVRQGIHPFPQDSFSGQDGGLRTKEVLAPSERPGVVLIAPVGQRDPK